MVIRRSLMPKQIFYDPRRKRWTYVRLLLDVLGIAITGLILFFVISAFRPENLNPLLMPQLKRNLHSVKQPEPKRKAKTRNTHRKTTTPASQVPLNVDEGIRAAYYVTWDAASFASLQEYYPQVDILFPEWLHVLTPDGHLQSVDAANQLFPVVQNNQVRSVDDKVMPFLKLEKAAVEVFPLINNFDPVNKVWLTNIGAFLNDPAARQTFREQLMVFLSSDRFKGAAFDFEEIPLQAQPDFRAL